MKKRLFSLIIVLAMLFTIMPNFQGVSAAETQDYDYALDRVIVKYKTAQSGFSRFSASSIDNVKSVKIINPKPSTGISSFSSVANESNQDKLALLELETEDNASLNQTISQLIRLDEVEYVERDYKFSAESFPTGWDSGNYAQLYGMRNISADKAWNDAGAVGSSDVVVGVIDTGIDFTHPDLSANKWVNPRPGWSTEYGNDLYGYDFVNRKPINDDYLNNDDNGHGTHVAGTIGATGQRANGVVGVSPNVRLVALKVLDQWGNGYWSDVIEAVNYANNMGIPITNNSYGGWGYSKALRDVIAEGGLFVASAGNDWNNNDVTPYYPASYDCENIITVAATDSNNSLASFTSYGQDTVDVAAPGVNVLSTRPGSSYGYLDGTSMAAPHVAGTAALTLPYIENFSKLSDPIERDWYFKDVVKALRTRVLDNVEPYDHLNGKVSTGGLVNAYYSVDPSMNPRVKSVTIHGDDSFTFDMGQHRTLTAEIDPLGFDQTIFWESSDDSVASVDQNGLVSAVGAGTATITAYAARDRDPEKADTCTVTVNAGEAITFADNNFKQAAINHLQAIDYEKYRYYTTESDIYPMDVVKLTSFSAYSAGIQDVQGIEYFTSLQSLDLGSNAITTLNVEPLTELTNLYLSHNRLTSIDLTKNTKLQYLSVWNNDLGELNLTKNTELLSLDCDTNPGLTELNLSNNTKLYHLDCRRNNFTSLDLTNNTALQSIYAHSGKLQTLILPNSSTLTTIYCYSNELTELDVSKNSALTQLYCYDNKLTSLNLESNPSLRYLQCENNDLAELKLNRNAVDSGWNVGDIYCAYNYLTIEGNLKADLDKIGARSGVTVSYDPQKYVPQPPAPTGITLNVSDTLKIDAESYFTIQAIVEPAGALQDVIFESSDVSVVTVKEDGVIYGVKPGTATVTVKSKHKSDVSASVEVEVTPIGLLYIQLSNGENIVADENGQFRVPLIIHGMNDAAKNGDWRLPKGSTGITGLNFTFNFVDFEDPSTTVDLDVYTTFDSEILAHYDLLSEEYYYNYPVEPGKVTLLESEDGGVFTEENGVIGYFVITPQSGYIRNNYKMIIDCTGSTFDDGKDDGNGNRGIAYLNDLSIRHTEPPANIYGKSLKAPVFDEYPSSIRLIEGVGMEMPTAKTDSDISLYPFAPGAYEEGYNFGAFVTVAVDSPDVFVDEYALPGEYTVKFMADDPLAPGLVSYMTVNVIVEQRVKNPMLTGSTDGSRWLTTENTFNKENGDTYDAATDPTYTVIVERSIDGGNTWQESFQVSSLTDKRKVDVAQHQSRAHFRYRARAQVFFNGRLFYSDYSNNAAVWRHNNAPELELTGDNYFGNSYFFGQTYYEIAAPDGGADARAFEVITAENKIPLETNLIYKTYVTKNINGSLLKIEPGKKVPSPEIDREMLADSVKGPELQKLYQNYITDYKIQYTVTDYCGNTTTKTRYISVHGELGDFKTSTLAPKDFERTLADRMWLTKWLKNYKSTANDDKYGFLDEDRKDIFRANLDGYIWDINALIDIVDRVAKADEIALNGNLVYTETAPNEYGIEQLLANINDRRMSEFQKEWKKVTTPQ